MMLLLIYSIWSEALSVACWTLTSESDGVWNLC